eukprot:TRINITY_DN17705_c0_g1_i1.p1 TRINITY_DN17705_c0_g1~~TRINITY_DN17705_c0_g1_i1.p1  ORF type:complete len:266 (+),score=46.26 TRINITY_DN17705_c0_g1_i1:44-799(+)
MRSDLDQELAGLMSIVKRSDKLLEEAHARSRDEDTSAPSEQVGGPSESIKSKVVVLEEKVNSLKGQVSTAQQIQATIQFGRREQLDECAKLNEKLSNVRNTLTLLRVSDSRKTFAADFQKRVIQTCFLNTPQTALPIAIMRGTDTFGQMELLCFTVPSAGYPWAENWSEFKRLFPLNDTWHSLLGFLTSAPEAEQIAPCSGTSPETSISRLRLPFAKGSKEDTLIRLMDDILQTDTRDLLQSFTSAAAKAG